MSVRRKQQTALHDGLASTVNGGSQAAEDSCTALCVYRDHQKKRGDKVIKEGN